ncbi:MAG: cytochrome c family protein [Pseudomonadota bacterium]
MQDPLFGNKLAGAVLTSLLLFFGVPQLADALLSEGGHHAKHGQELHLAYPIEFETESGAKEEEAPTIFDLGATLAAASASGGERRAQLCKSCHSFEKGGPNGTGPNLWNIVGREIASVDGFSYSGALKDFGGAWTYERLDGYLKNSQNYVPGTAMMQRFPKDKPRADIVAYLGSLSDDPAPFPAPLAASEETGEAPASESGR